MATAKLHCYCCGAKLDGKPFVLVAYGLLPVDRVFVMRPECTTKIENQLAFQLLVARMKPTK